MYGHFPGIKWTVRIREVSVRRGSTLVINSNTGDEAPSILRPKKLKTEVSLWKRIKWVFCLHCGREIWPATQQPPVRLEFCMKKTRAAVSLKYRKVIVCEKFRFQNGFHPHLNTKPASSNSSGLKSVMDGRPNSRSKAAFFTFLWHSTGGT